MAKRKFSGGRLFNLVRIIVNVIAVIAIILGTITLSKQEDTLSFYLVEQANCFKEFPESILFCSIYDDLIREAETFPYYYLAVGIGLPVLFYGGTWLYRYIFPVETK